MQPLCVGEDAAVANGTPGAEDAVQRVRREVQVGSASARIQTRGEPHLRADAALQLSPESDGAPSPEGAAPPPTATATAAAATGGAMLPSQA